MNVEVSATERIDFLRLVVNVHQEFPDEPVPSFEEPDGFETRLFYRAFANRPWYQVAPDQVATEAESLSMMGTAWTRYYLPSFLQAMALLVAIGDARAEAIVSAIRRYIVESRQTTPFEGLTTSQAVVVARALRLAIRYGYVDKGDYELFNGAASLLEVV